MWGSTNCTKKISGESLQFEIEKLEALSSHLAREILTYKQETRRNISRLEYRRTLRQGLGTRVCPLACKRAFYGSYFFLLPFDRRFDEFSEEWVRLGRAWNSG